MKKTTMTLFAGIIAISLLSVGCGGKYSDVKKANGEFVDLVEGFSADIEEVENAEDAAEFLNQFADGLQEIMPKMREFSEKYPELEGDANFPEELKEFRAETQAVAEKMSEGLMKLMKYRQDPEVMKAQQRFAAIMSR